MYCDYQSSKGCDSTVILYLTVINKVETLLEYNLCPGDFVLVNNKEYRTGGEFTDTLVGSNECDSVLLIKINALDAKSSTTTETICAGTVDKNHRRNVNNQPDRV